MTPDVVSIVLLLGSFLLLIVLRVPIAYAVGVSTVLCLMNMGTSLTTLATQMVKGVWSYSLMAVPFFITMGCLMGTGGISDKLVALANSLVGWMRGGLAMVNCVDSYFFGGISGSAAADTAQPWLHHHPHDGRAGVRRRLCHGADHHLLRGGHSGSA